MVSWGQILLSRGGKRKACNGCFLTGVGPQGGDTSETISSQVIAAGRGGGIGTVRGNHVVDGRLVDAVVGDAHDTGENNGRDPVGLVRAEAGP